MQALISGAADSIEMVTTQCSESVVPSEGALGTWFSDGKHGKHSLVGHSDDNGAVRAPPFAFRLSRSPIHPSLL